MTVSSCCCSTVPVAPGYVPATAATPPQDPSQVPDQTQGLPTAPPAAPAPTTPPTTDTPVEPTPPVGTDPSGDDGSTGQAEQGVRELQGVDVSHYQGTIDWQAARGDGIGAAYLKATESTTYTDDQYDRNRTNANAAGVVTGAYHFARPGTNGGSVEADARGEAQYFLETADLQSGDLVPALDLEADGGLSRTDLARWTRTWLDTVADAIGGRKPIVYVSPSFWSDKVDDTLGIAEDFPLWVANWGVNSPRTPGDWDAWQGWQQTSDGTVDGIRGRVDRDVFRVGSGDTLSASDVGQH